MNLDPLSWALSQITCLISNLNKKNFTTSTNELLQLVGTYGSAAERHLLRSLFVAVDPGGDAAAASQTCSAAVGGGGGKGGATGNKDRERDKDREHWQIQCLGQCYAFLLTKSSFVSSLCFAVDNPIKPWCKGVAQLVPHLGKALRLNRIQEVVLGLALLPSNQSELKEQALVYLKQKLPDLIKPYIQSEAAANSRVEGGFQDSSPEVLHLILTYLLPNPAQFGLDEQTIEALLSSLRKDYHPQLVPVILAPLIYPKGIEDPLLDTMAHEGATIPKNMLESSLGEVMVETGYRFTASLEECRNHVTNLGFEDLSAATVARALGVMIRTYSGLPEAEAVKDVNGETVAGPTTWNIDVWVQTVTELSPKLNWKEVVYECDHQGFFVKDRQALKMLFSAWGLGLQIQGTRPENFPVELIYRRWKNSEGQFSVISMCLKNPDVFCFADYPHRQVNVDTLKAVPDLDNKEVATWKSVDLIECLAHLADSVPYNQVQELLKFPVQHCPDLLVLGLLQITTYPLTGLRKDILTNLLPVFLGTHPNSAVVLHHTWLAQGGTMKPLLIGVMAEWYLRGDYDQQRLSRILDVAQDLKALSMLLNAQPFPFVIDLACLASRREYLKLDKWLSDKIREHGEPFVVACIKFLQRRCPQLVGKEDSLKTAPLPPETLALVLSCLQACAGNVSQELSETILTMVANCNLLLTRSRQPPPGVKAHRALESAFNASALSNQLFPSPGADNLSSLNVGMSSLSLSNANTLPSSSTFPLSIGPGPTGLSCSLTAPGSPGKLYSGVSLGGTSGGQAPGNPLSLPNPSSSFNLSMLNSLSASASTGLGMGGTSSLLSGTSSALANLSLNSITNGGQTTSGAGGLGSSHSALSRIGVQQANVERRSDLAGIFSEVAQPVSKEIEDETNSYFQRIYNQSPHAPTLTVDEVLEMLKKFQESPNKREREVFNCMLRNLFEEYRFFPQYPDKELHITAQLFGGIVEHGLVTYMALGIALRYVLDALRKPHGSKMYYFGITALDRFRHRLKDYAQYCQHLAAIPHYHEFPAHLVEYIDYGSRSQEPPNRPHGPVLPASLAAALGTATGSTTPGIPVSTGSVSPAPSGSATNISTPSKTSLSSAGITSTTGTPAKPAIAATLSGGRPSIANSTNIDTLLHASEKEETICPPVEAVQDKISFIFNNLSQINLTQKCEEFREIVTDDMWPWVAQYLVMKRASIEPNFHTLYSMFLDTLKVADLTRMAVRETFRNVKVLLRSDKCIANYSDRSLLKNLGHWLGLLTIAKNKPIISLDLDVKSLIIEAYHKGQQELLYVIPFVAKVVESSAKSKVFKPPNPWTMGIMNVLAELHQEPDLKLNLKFEIEVLCKTLNIDLQELKPGCVLKDPVRFTRLETQLSLPQQQQQQQQQAQQQHQGQMAQLQMPSQQRALVEESPQSAALGVAGLGMNMVMPFASGGLMAAAAAAAAAAVATSSATPPVQAPPTVTTPTPAMPLGPPEPHYSYADINVSSIAGLAPHIVINTHLPLFQAQPHLKTLVLSAVERAVQEWILPVVERTIKIALTTCEQIIKKDFALDPDESRIRAAAHHMMRTLTAGMALITCRDHLLVSIATNLKAAATASLRVLPKEIIEQMANQVSQDNVELACVFIQKTAVEKAIPEIDKRLAHEFELRKQARSEGRRYCDTNVLTYQAERMPEQIRLKVGGVNPQQAAVYDEFARNIPGFLPITERDAALFMPKPLSLPSYGSEEVTTIYEKLAVELDRYMQVFFPLGTTPQSVAISALMEAVLLAGASRELNSALSLIQKAIEGLLEGLVPGAAEPEVMVRFRDAHLLVLKALQDPQAYGPQWVCRQVTRFMMECREDIRYNLEAVDCLIRAHLVNVHQYDLLLAAAMEGQSPNQPPGQVSITGPNPMAVAFAMQLVHLYVVEGQASGTPLLAEQDLTNTVEMLAKLAAHARPVPEGLATLLDLLRANHEQNLADRPPGGPGGPTALIHSGISQAREYDDPAGLPEKTEYLLQQWVNMYHTPGRDMTKAFSVIVNQMNIHGILKTDDHITRFFRLCTQLCVDLVYRSLSDPSLSPGLVRNKCFHTLDAFVRLIALLVKHSGDAGNTLTKINLINKVLGIVAGVLLQDHEIRGVEFQQLAYHRIFIMLFLELNAPEPVLDAINFQVLTAFCNTLHILRPAKAPGFAYAWLELVSHRVFIGRMLAITPQQKGWGMYAQLLIDLFKFLAPFLRNAELGKPVSMLYKGTLRVLLVLLHDFPEFLCDYHYGFCDVIPPNCIQMRNLILSAFPRNMRLPDPFTPNLKVDLLPEIAHAPRVLTHFAAMIQPPALKKDLDSYLKTRTPVTFLSELRSVVQAPLGQEPGHRYSLPLLNALVLYVGTQAITTLQNKGLTPSMATIGHSSHMDIFQSLAVNLDTEGRYLFINAIANQLRYPNSHTHYFSCILLCLFAEANAEAIQEQITRVLLERLIVNRPHPWGLLITFIELIKNPTFKFWTHEFVHCAPEIEKLFESVARSCMVQKQGQREVELQDG